jgi:AcrB/AcrD/AcrF family protein
LREEFCLTFCGAAVGWRGLAVYAKSIHRRISSGVRGNFLSSNPLRRSSNEEKQNFGRLFREFAVTLSLAIAVSMLVSLTLTPMMCVTLLRSSNQERHSRFYQSGERLFRWLLEK